MVLIRVSPCVLRMMDLPGCSVGEGRLKKVIHLNLPVSNGSTIQQCSRVHYSFPKLKTRKEGYSLIVWWDKRNMKADIANLCKLKIRFVSTLLRLLKVCLHWYVFFLNKNYMHRWNHSKIIWNHLKSKNAIICMSGQYLVMQVCKGTIRCLHTHVTLYIVPVPNVLLHVDFWSLGLKLHVLIKYMSL